MKHFLRKLVRDAVLWLVTRRVLRWSKHRVMGGPFRGMRYCDHAVCSSLAPKILGSYEQELRGIIESIRGLHPSVVIDVGAAEGYYAVGLLFAKITPAVIAFEPRPTGQRLLRKLAEMNAVDLGHLTILGLCTPSILEDCLSRLEKPVMIMDVEGYEALLLDPQRIRHLAKAHILAEMHDGLLDGMTEALTNRMEATHTVVKITATPRTLDDIGCSDTIFGCLPQRWRLLAASEGRPPSMNWLWMTPKASPAIAS